MTKSLYGPGAAHASTLITSGDYDTSSPWSFSAEDGDKLLGPSGDDWKNYASFHLCEDSDENAETKARYKYPFGKAGKVYSSGLRAIKSRAGQQGDTSIGDEAGKLLDEINRKEGKEKDKNNLSPKAENFPDYDPDGDGDNDAQEAFTLIGSAIDILCDAQDSLCGRDETDKDAKKVGGRSKSNVLAFNRTSIKSILKISAATNDSMDMDLFGIIGGGGWFDESGITKEQFAQTLNQIPTGVKKVNLRMSSPGGDVFEGRAIANMISDHPCSFDCNVIAESCSIASIIAMSCDNIHMSDGAVMLIHRSWAFTVGNSLDLKKLAQDLDTIDESMVRTYSKKTGMKPADVLSLMDENRYMSADEAKQKGFVDSISGNHASNHNAVLTFKIAAMKIDRDRFHLPPLPNSVADSKPRREAALAVMERIKRVG